MAKKREYIPANIRTGCTVQEAASVLREDSKATNYRVEITTFDHGRDINGNGTAHYKVQLLCTGKDGHDHYLLTIVESGKRREQVGYSGQNEAALYALYKLGFEVDTSKAGSYDYQGSAVYPLLNFPPVEA